MSDCKKSEPLFDSYYFGQLTREDKIFLENHLRDCPKCRAQLRENTLLLSAVSKKQRKDPGPQFWGDYTPNLRQRMITDGVFREKQSRFLSILSDSFDIAPRWALQAAAAAMILIVGIFVGREFFSLTPPPAPGPDNTLQVTQVFQKTSHFLERSRVILMALDNFDPETESSIAINLPYQQQVSRELVQQAGYLKQELSAVHQRRLTELIDELEIILLQIANIDSASELETIQLVKSGDSIRGILFKIRLTDLRRSINKMSKTQTI